MKFIINIKKKDLLELQEAVCNADPIDIFAEALQIGLNQLAPKKQCVIGFRLPPDPANKPAK